MLGGAAEGGARLRHALPVLRLRRSRIGWPNNDAQPPSFPNIHQRFYIGL